MANQMDNLHGEYKQLERACCGQESRRQRNAIYASKDTSISKDEVAYVAHVAHSQNFQARSCRSGKFHATMRIRFKKAANSIFQDPDLHKKF
jgi:hypothetical protein